MWNPTLNYPLNNFIIKLGYWDVYLYTLAIFGAANSSSSSDWFSTALAAEARRFRWFTGSLTVTTVSSTTCKEEFTWMCCHEKLIQSHNKIQRNISYLLLFTLVVKLEFIILIRQLLLLQNVVLSFAWNRHVFFVYFGFMNSFLCRVNDLLLHLSGMWVWFCRHGLVLGLLQ